MNNNLCPDCGQDHSGLPVLWPVGTEVKAQTWYTFRDYSGVITRVDPGTPGRVTGHTEDGRPLIIFDGFDGAHSFHYPEQALEVVSGDGEYWPEPLSVARTDDFGGGTVKDVSPSRVQARLGSWVLALNAVRDGLNGHSFSWTAGETEAHRPKLAMVGVTLITKTQAGRRGYRLKRGVKPVGRGYFRSPISRSADLYVLECQCVKESEATE